MVHNTLLYFATEALRVVQGLVVLVNQNDNAAEGTGVGIGACASVCGRATKLFAVVECASGISLRFVCS